MVECAQNVHDEEGLKAADATDIVVSRMKGESPHYMYDMSNMDTTKQPQHTKRRRTKSKM